MSNKFRAAITGVGGYVPDYVLGNQELETMVETNDEWILSRTGIKERRILKGEGKGTSHLCEMAVKELLEKTNTKPSEVEAVICATVTPDYIFPSTANLVCEMVGIKNALSFDLAAACTGFLYALATGAQFIETGKYKKVIVIGADKMSSIINYKDRTTCILFGDGAAAVMLEPIAEESGLGIFDSILRSDGVGEDFLHAKGGGSRYPTTKETVDNNMQYIFQEGSSVFKYAVSLMADVSAEIMQKNNLSKDDVNWLVPHQANKRIIDATAKRMGLSDDKVLINIEKYGNTTAATIPLVLWDFEKKFKKGDSIIMAAFGGGFTWGSAYLKWAY